MSYLVSPVQIDNVCASTDFLQQQIFDNSRDIIGKLRSPEGLSPEAL